MTQMRSNIQGHRKFHNSGSGFDILSRRGREDVAEVYVGCFRNSKKFSVECVDGLDVDHPREKKWIINISTQFGCPVGCLFCDAGGDYHGNLSAEEMLAQISFIAGQHPELKESCPKLKVHFARMGEPALNDAVLDAAAALPAFFEYNPGLWCCLATVAPADRDDWFERLLDVKERFFRGRFQLQFSVNSTDQAERERLMPIKLWSLKKISEYGQAFHQKNDRTVVLNFALYDGGKFETSIISDTFNPDHFSIKLTPVNPTTRGQEFGLMTLLRSAAGERLKESCKRLESAGFDVIISVGDEREDDIGSNCGQSVRRLYREL